MSKRRDERYVELARKIAPENVYVPDKPQVMEAVSGTGAFVETFMWVPWEESDEYPAGTLVKTLRDEGDARSILLKLPAGFSMGAHTHTCCEQHFVLRGAYEVGGVEQS